MKVFRTALPLLCVMVLTVFAAVGEAAVGDIVTVAGGAIRDGGPAILASLFYPADVAVDNAGKVYIVDQGHNRIRLVTPGAGGAPDIISTVAGSATGGFADGPATSAALRAPTGIAMDGAGNIYIADQGNNRIRKVSGGVMTTVAGTGAAGYTGDGGPATSATLNQPFAVTVDPATGDLYFSDQGNNAIRKIAANGVISTVAGNGTPGSGGDNGPATAATVHQPAGIAIDGSGNLYFSDQWNNRVRKISATGIITAFAGDGTPGYAGDHGPATSAWLGGPGGITVRGTDVYIVDRENHVLRKVSGGVITTLAGTGGGGYAGDGGPAAQAVLRHPSGVALDANGNIFITEQGNSLIRRITAATGIIDTFAGGGSGDYGGDNGPATAASLHMPWSVAVHGADIYFSDSLNNRIRMVSGATGIITTVVGSGFGGFFGDGGPALDARMGNPRGIAIDSNTGDLYIADTVINRVRMVSARTGIISTVAGNGTAGYAGDGGAATAASLTTPVAVALDSAGNLYIADQGNNVIRKVSAGIISTVAGNGTAAYAGDGGPATSASLNTPAGVSVDGSGNIYIADMDNHRVRKVSASGTISTVAGNGTAGVGTFADNVPATATSVYFPAAARVDNAGNLLIVDQYNMRIRKVSGGIITTIAGDGMWDYAGDFGPATAASISYPTDIALDSSGNIFIADRINNAVRKLSAAAAGPSAPGAPTGVSAVAGNAQATITFTAPASTGGSAITGYTVTSNPAGGVDSNAGSTALSHVVTGLTNGTSYTFTVTARNAAGTGPASATSNAVTPAAQVSVPSAPTITGIIDGNGQATVIFSAPASDGGSAVTGYTVTSSPAGGVDSNAGSTALSHLITGLTNKTAYTFTVTARNAAGAGAPSAPSAAIVPVNPHDGIVVPGTGKASLDIGDVVLALRYVAGTGTLTAAEITHADVAPLGADGNPLGNGVVDLGDVIIMLRRSLGIGNW